MEKKNSSPLQSEWAASAFQAGMKFYQSFTDQGTSHFVYKAPDVSEPLMQNVSVGFRTSCNSYDLTPKALIGSYRIKTRRFGKAKWVKKNKIIPGWYANLIRAKVLHSFTRPRPKCKRPQKISYLHKSYRVLI